MPTAPAGHAQQHAGNDQADELELDDDELLELVGDLPEHADAARQQPSGPGHLVTANVAQEGEALMSVPMVGSGLVCLRFNEHSSNCVSQQVCCNNPATMHC